MARIKYDAEIGQQPREGDRLNYLIEFSQNPGTGEQPTYSIHNEELHFGDRCLFNRSEDLCEVSGLSDLRTSGQSIFAAIRRAEWTEEFNETLPLVAHCAKEISRVGRYRLDPSLLRRPGRVIDVRPDDSPEPPWAAPRLAYRGDDLASVLYILHETRSPILGQIAESVAEAVQGFEGFEFNRVGVDRVGFSARFGDRRGAVVAPNLSDGCLSMIGLMTLAVGPGRPGVLCIEEPENGLTPTATRVFYRTVRKLADVDGVDRSQVLLSSHSPFVIVDAWNGNERDFIYQCNPVEGRAVLNRFSEVITGAGALGSGGELGLRLAEQIMDGFRYRPELDTE